MITIDDRSTDRVFGFHVKGRLTRADYRLFLPRLEEAIQAHGRISVLVQISSLEGIDPGAVWEELKFDIKHLRDFDRLALVGDKRWHERAITLARCVTSAKTMYFPTADLEQAWTWIEAGEREDVSPHDGIGSVLVATDFSDNARMALEWAISLAGAHHASTNVLHVVPVTSIGSLPAGVQDRVSRDLESIAARARDAGVAVTTQWQIGAPWAVISAEAQEHDLVVLGARGHTRFPPLILGSTADRVLRSAPVPVLTIHHEDQRFDHMPRQVIVATDFSEAASEALSAVVDIFGVPSDERMNITLLHAWQPLADYGDQYEVVPMNPYVSGEQQAREMLERLAAKTSATGIDVTAVVRVGYPTRVIEQEAEATGAELVAVGAHGHSGLARFMLGSVAERVVHRLHCPVLAVGQPTAGRAAGEPAAQTARAAR
jgi:nucleotide-binding universal stress UspA family protein